MNPDFLDLLRVFVAARARFLVVGAHAMAVHGVPRATGDLDIWVSPDAANAGLVWDALLRFGAPIEQVGITRRDLETPDLVLQFGQPPWRIDLLTGISGVTFEEAWPNRVERTLEGVSVSFLGHAELVRNKRATGRPKDLVDLEFLERGKPGPPALS